MCSTNSAELFPQKQRSTRSSRHATTDRLFDGVVRTQTLAFTVWLLHVVTIGKPYSVKSQLCPWGDGDDWTSGAWIPR